MVKRPPPPPPPLALDDYLQAVRPEAVPFVFWQCVLVGGRHLYTQHISNLRNPQYSWLCSGCLREDRALLLLLHHRGVEAGPHALRMDLRVRAWQVPHQVACASSWLLVNRQIPAHLAAFQSDIYGKFYACLSLWLVQS